MIDFPLEDKVLSQADRWFTAIDKVLTPLERKVMRGVIAGKSESEIGEEVGRHMYVVRRIRVNLEKKVLGLIVNDWASDFDLFKKG